MLWLQIFRIMQNIRRVHTLWELYIRLHNGRITGLNTCMLCLLCVLANHHLLLCNNRIQLFKLFTIVYNYLKCISVI